MVEVKNGKKILTTPISAEDLEGIHVGDIVYLNGSMTTCRDVAHRRLVEEHRELPVDVKDAAIISFVVNGVNGVINESAETISIVLPYGTDLTSLKPVITLSGATSVSPASGETVNLSGPVTYTVTGEDGTTKTYKVTAVTSEQPKSDKLWESMLEQTGGSTDHTGKNTWWKKAKDMKKHNDYPKYW